jgi:hypothetical protein
MTLISTAWSILEYMAHLRMHDTAFHWLHCMALTCTAWHWFALHGSDYHAIALISTALHILALQHWCMYTAWHPFWYITMYGTWYCFKSKPFPSTFFSSDSKHVVKLVYNYYHKSLGRYVMFPQQLHIQIRYRYCKTYKNVKNARLKGETCVDRNARGNGPLQTFFQHEKRNICEPEAPGMDFTNQFALLHIYS